MSNSTGHQQVRIVLTGRVLSKVIQFLSTYFERGWRTNRKKKARDVQTCSVTLLHGLYVTRECDVVHVWKDIRRGGTLLQAVSLVRGSYPLNIHPYPLPTRATLPNRHSFARNEYLV
ncbi:hypothetical protein RF11_08148 [Thelohanellus kitauei]|uniref:Uncharacterized protein n=1 Tax=Thelohanellus kitauei TaxID=669202 RepID=A0A0C2MYZ9_THEKT|nr:hypothetical protein RF11_08148 [Thelohanellus kitauei]